MSDRPKRNRKKSRKQIDADASNQHLQDDDDELLFITIEKYEYDISEIQKWPIEIYDETSLAKFKTIYVLAEGTDYVNWVLSKVEGSNNYWSKIEDDVLSEAQLAARESLFRADSDSDEADEDEEDEEDSDSSDFINESESDDEIVEDEDVEFQDSGAQRGGTELALIQTLLRNSETALKLAPEEIQILITLEEMNTENDNVEKSKIIRDAKNILVYFLLVFYFARADKIFARTDTIIVTHRIRKDANKTIFKDLFNLLFVNTTRTLNRTAQELNKIWNEGIFYSTLIVRLISFELLNADDPITKELLKNLRNLSHEQQGFTETRFLLRYQDVPVLTNVLNFVYGPIANLKQLDDDLLRQEGDTLDEKYGNYYRNEYTKIMKQARNKSSGRSRKRQRLSVLKF